MNLARTLPDGRLDPQARALLEGLQANILKSHVRTALALLVVRLPFDVGPDEDLGARLAEPGAADRVTAGRRYVRGVAARMKSAHQHLHEVERYREVRRRRQVRDRRPAGRDAADARSTPYVGLGLSAAGYRAVGIDIGAPGAVPVDPAFVAGMPGRRETLGDPGPDDWETPYLGRLHALVLVASGGDDVADAVRAVDAEVAELSALADEYGVDIGIERGVEWRNRDGAVAEHFGFADGVSDPVFLEADRPKPLDGQSRLAWDPMLTLDQVLVPDLGTDGSAGYGSYLVYRKLEQHVADFQRSVDALAKHPPLENVDAQTAAAMLVGRRRDGTSLIRDPADGREPRDNDFSYARDPFGLRCPAVAHVRKVNPRTTDSGVLDPVSGRRLRRRLTRRGQTYGERGPEPAADAPPEAYPEADVGVLFLAFVASVTEQFEFVQTTWADDRFAPVVHGIATDGVDQVVGPEPRGEVSLPDGRLGPMRRVPAVPLTVTFKGGEYVFTPSLPFLRGLPDLGA